MTTTPALPTPEELRALLDRLEEKASELREYRHVYAGATAKTELVYAQGQDRLEDDLDAQARRYLSLLDDVSRALHAQAAALESRGSGI